MTKMTTEAKVGLLVLGGSILLLWMTFAVGKYQFGQKKGYILHAVFDSVAGIDLKAAVRMAGVKIGTVEHVELQDSRARIDMQIDPDVRILHGSKAMIKTMGLLGEKYVEIVPPREETGGQAGGMQAYYANGEEVHTTVSPSDVDKLINQLSSIADDIKQVTGSLRQALGTPAGAQSLEDMVNDLHHTTENIRDFSSTLRSDGSELVMRLNELAASLNGVVDENRDNLKMSLANIRDASKNAELALASIENAARKIDQGQGTIGKLVNDSSMYDNIDTAAKGITDYVSRIERMKTVIGFRTEYLFPEAKSYASLELMPRPDKYYLLEITSDPFGKYQRTETTTTPPGSTVTTETYQDQFKFSLEFAKRWGNLALRLGLIESTGGVGADYYALDDRFRFSVDAWNFGSKEPDNQNAHLKATAAYNINPVLFVDAGYDNALNSKRAMPFAGIGLRFDDEDLKYLLGSVPVPK